MHDTPHPASGSTRLADHLCACRIGDQVVLLDLDRNRYFSLIGPHARLVANAIEPFEGDTNDKFEPATSTCNDRELIAALLRAQILTLDPDAARPDRTRLSRPVSSLELPTNHTASSLQPSDIYRFVSAVAIASIWLRFRTLRDISKGIGARIQQCEASTPAHETRRTNAVTVFDRLRPLAFTSRDRCLFDSLALAVFLAQQGLRSCWVVGIKTRPFRAHSWVQHEGVVLNDLHDHVGPFTPILVV